MAVNPSLLTLREEVGALTNAELQRGSDAQEVMSAVAELPVYRGKYADNQASHFAFNWRDGVVAGRPNAAAPVEVAGWYGPTGGPPGTRRPDPGAQTDVSDVPAGTVAVSDAVGALVLSARALNDNDDWEWTETEADHDHGHGHGRGRLRVLRPRCAARGFDDDGALVFGEDNSAAAPGSAALAGEDNRVQRGAESSVALGGECNTVGAWGWAGRWTSRAAAVAGISNRVEFENSVALGGADGSVRGNSSAIVAGVCNSVERDGCEASVPSASVVVGGFGNTAWGDASAILASTNATTAAGSQDVLVAACEECSGDGRNTASLASQSGTTTGQRTARVATLYSDASGADAAVVASYASTTSANANRSAVLASDQSQANGTCSAVVAGRNALATGTGAFAGGNYARSAGTSTFAWGTGGSTTTTTAQGNNSVALGNSILAANPDSVTLAFGNPGTSMGAAANGFQGLFPGGFEVYTNNALSSGFRVTSGSSSFGSICQRQFKENIAPVDCAALLAQARTLPVYVYNYKGNDAEQKALGPVADEFFARFGPLLGAKKDHSVIEAMDYSSVILAALQGLSSRVDTLVRNTRRAAGLPEVLPGDEDALLAPAP